MSNVEHVRSSSDLFNSNGNLFSTSPPPVPNYFPPPISSPKALVHRWQVTETELGRGAFGQVFMGMNSDTGELIAVKRVKIEGTSEEQEQVKIQF